MPKIRKWLKKRHYQPILAINKNVTSAQSPNAAVAFDVVSEQQLVPYDENLLERSRTQWQFGDWASLANLSRDILQHHPDRAKLALLAAAGHQAMGNPDEARQYTRLAIDYGCSKTLVSRILIAVVHNTLGRAAAVANQQSRAMRHFEASIGIGSPGTEVRLLSQARAGQQLHQLGLALGSVGGRQVIKLIAAKVPAAVAPPQPQAATPSVFSPDTYAFYQGLSERVVETTGAKFVLLDSKSLPRSGLHYMKNTFAKLLGENFSFCEWYQEPGCCKQMPCALTGYAQHSAKANTSKLRLTKSHDFDLTDPTFLPNTSARRVVLIRHPLFVLTSWFGLEQLVTYKTELLKAGINMEKIWLSHEPEVLATAYRVMDEAFVAPSAEVLARWLAEKAAYIAGFVDKWVTPAMASANPFCRVVRYEEIDSFIEATAAELRVQLPAEARSRIDAFAENNASEFKRRGDPFHAPSPRLACYLAENSHQFSETASHIVSHSRNWIPQ